MAHRRPEHYLASIGDELQSTADQVRHLIGNKHWLSDGHHKEAVLRKTLGKHMPVRFSLDRGFVVDNERLSKCSKEQDILIIDQSISKPLFNESDIAISFADDVHGAISVKTTMKPSELKDSLTGLASIRWPKENKKAIIGIFAYRMQMRWRNSIRLYADYLRKQIDTNRILLEKSDLFICVNGALFSRISMDNAGEMNISTHDCGRLSAAMFVGTIADAICADNTSAKSPVALMMQNMEFEPVS
ncbi:DUF6602 domain-containing protein [Rhodopirellula baltica]|nr:DUF6602 domain-containing protein [Rhodopirellula baltica]